MASVVVFPDEPCVPVLKDWRRAISEAVPVELPGGNTSLAVRFISEAAKDFEGEPNEAQNLSAADRLLVYLAELEGDDYPTQTEYATPEGVAKGTVPKAVQRLVADNLISRTNGRKLEPTRAGLERARHLLSGLAQASDWRFPPRKLPESDFL